MKLLLMPSSMTARGAVVRAAIAAVAVGLTVWAQLAPLATESLFGNEWLRDRIVRARATSVPETRLAVVDVDEVSLKELGPWPWPRERIATLLELLLTEYGARGVALDFVFPEPADGDGDARVGALAQYGPLVIAQAFDFEGNTPLRVGELAGGFTAPKQGEAVAASGFIANHKAMGSAAHTGNIGFIPDKDGMIRRLPMQVAFLPCRWPCLIVATTPAWRNCRRHPRPPAA